VRGQGLADALSAKKSHKRITKRKESFVFGLHELAP
jgi:hypothetical protein